MSYLTCVVPEPIHVRFRRLSLEGSFSFASLPKFVVPLASRGGTWVFFGVGMCRSKLQMAPRSKKKFPEN